MRRNYGKAVPRVEKPWFSSVNVPTQDTDLFSRLLANPMTILAESEFDRLRIQKIADECRVPVVIRVGG